MGLAKKAAIILFMLLLGVLLYAVPRASQTLPTDVTISAGAAWSQGNATRMYLDVNTTRALVLNVSYFDQPVPKDFWLHNRSDQKNFANFSNELAGLLSEENVTLHVLNPDHLPREPGFVFLAGPWPSVLDVNRLVQRGFVVAYAGLPFDQPRLGFHVRDPLNGDIRVSYDNQTSVDQNGWQVVAAGRGHFLYRSQMLDQAWPDGPAAARNVADFFLNTRWLTPLAKHRVELNQSRTLWSSAFFSPSVWATVRGGNPSTRFWNAFSSRVSAYRVWMPENVTWPQPVSFSAMGVSEDLTLIAVQDDRRAPLGTFHPVQGAVYATLSTENLTGGPCRLLALTPRGETWSESFFTVNRYDAKLLLADASAKTFLVLISSASAPLSSQQVGFSNQTVFTSEDGIARFKGTPTIQTIFEVQGVSVRFSDTLATGQTPWGLYSILGSVGILLFCWAIARWKGKTFVRFTSPKRLVRKKIKLDAPMLSALFKRRVLTLDQIASELSRSDPFLRIDLFSLEKALEHFVNVGMLKKRGACYCLEKKS